MSAVLLSLNNVTIRYADLSMFSNIDLEVVRGQHLAICGNNEPLKNALMDAMAGVVPVINGAKTFPLLKEQASTDGHSAVSPHRFIAFVSARHTFKNLSNTSEFYYQQRFNSSDSENSLTVHQYLTKRAVAANNQAASVDGVVQSLNLYKLLNEGVIKLSNGETRRVLIAAALLQNPLLLILHNPLAGLDENSRREITMLINRVAEQGATVVMTCHAHEIPNAVKQVVVVDKDARLRKIAKEDYAITVEPDQPVLIDTTSLSALLERKPMPVFNTIVDMQNVSISYAGKKILDDINWTILQGERWALQGANGAGKSTLLSLINGDNPQAFANNIVLFDRKKGYRC